MNFEQRKLKGGGKLYLRSLALTEYRSEDSKMLCKHSYIKLPYSSKLPLRHEAGNNMKQRSVCPEPLLRCHYAYKLDFNVKSLF